MKPASKDRPFEASLQLRFLAAMSSPKSKRTSMNVRGGAEPQAAEAEQQGLQEPLILTARASDVP